jgi:hypothetical protein
MKVKRRRESHALALRRDRVNLLLTVAGRLSSIILSFVCENLACHRNGGIDRALINSLSTRV